MVGSHDDRVSRNFHNVAVITNNRTFQLLKKEPFSNYIARNNFPTSNRVRLDYIFSLRSQICNSHSDETKLIFHSTRWTSDESFRTYEHTIIV